MCRRQWTIHLSGNDVLAWQAPADRAGQITAYGRAGRFWALADLGSGNHAPPVMGAGKSSWNDGNHMS